MAPNSLGADDLGPNSVESSEIAANAVGTDEVSGLTAVDIGRTGSVTADIGAITAGSCERTSTILPGAATGDPAVVGANPHPFQNGIALSAIAVTNGIFIQLCNVTGVTLDPPNSTYQFVALDF